MRDVFLVKQVEETGWWSSSPTTKLFLKLFLHTHSQPLFFFLMPRVTNAKFKNASLMCVLMEKPPSNLVLAFIHRKIKVFNHVLPILQLNKVPTYSTPCSNLEISHAGMAATFCIFCHFINIYSLGSV